MARPCSRMPARWAWRASCRSVKRRVTALAVRQIGSSRRTRVVRPCSGRQRRIGEGGRDNGALATMPGQRDATKQVPQAETRTHTAVTPIAQLSRVCPAHYFRQNSLSKSSGCGRWDSNPHGLSPPLGQNSAKKSIHQRRVYLFRHARRAW
jgi:hypothetical protein